MAKRKHEKEKGEQKDREGLKEEENEESTLHRMVLMLYLCNYCTTTTVL